MHSATTTASTNYWRFSRVLGQFGCFWKGRVKGKTVKMWGKLTRSSVTAEVAHVVPVIHMLPKPGSLDYIFVVDSMSLSFSEFNTVGSESGRFG